MEKQAIPQPTKQARGSGIIGTILLAVVATALVVGSGIYLWQKSSLNAAEQRLQRQAALLQNQLSEFKKERSDSKIIKEPAPTTLPDASSDIKFPVVVYGRPGLLNNTEEGKAEKKRLEERLINPYADYYNEDGINLVAMNITVPHNIGEEYDVVAIFGSKKQYGTHEFGFGKREQEYGYWKPDCMGQCDFSEAFKAKYPQIVE